MSSTTMPNETERQRKLKKEMIITVGFIGTALAVGTILYLVFGPRVERPLPTDPPPIIIKSGSFIFETDTKLEPDEPDKRNYKRQFVGGIKGIRITSYNELVKDKTIDEYIYVDFDSKWAAGERVEVNIEVQRCADRQPTINCVTWNVPEIIKISDTNTEFLISTQINLTKNKNNKKNKRKFKLEDNYDATIRIRGLRIVNISRNPNIIVKENLPAENQEYIIAFYNQL